VNVFLVEWAPLEGADLSSVTSALTAYVDEVPFLSAAEIRSWRSPDGSVAVATASHSEQEAAARYAAFDEERFALYAGRPIRWGPDGEADGVSALDPRSYLSPPQGWAEALGGRCTVVRYDRESATLEVFTDTLGSYPVYSTTEDGKSWISNSAAILDSVVGGRSLNTRSLASFLACNWVLGGGTLWDGIVPLPPASVHRYRRDRSVSSERRLTVESRVAAAGRGLDAHEASRVLVSTIRAMADWPGRPVRVPLSGGRDSRLVFAAALRAGFDFETVTTAFPNLSDYPETVDVVLARRIAETYGRSHSVAPPEPGLSVRQSARLLRLAANGLVSLATTGVLRGYEPGRPLPLYQSGQAGEISRRAYVYAFDADSPAKIGEAIYKQFVGALPRPIVNGDAKQVVAEHLSGWIDEHLEQGLALRDLPDVFYLSERLANWAGPSHRVYDYVNDLTSPLWEPALLPHALALPADDREHELFHLRLLEVLAPGLAQIPFDGLAPRWPGHRQTASARAQRYRVLWSRIARELRRRRQAMRDTAAGDPLLEEGLSLARECVSALPGHPAWDVLDRKRVLGLVKRNPASFDPRSRRLLLDLVSVFAAEPGVPDPRTG
jgi:hypothetical protein